MVLPEWVTSVRSLHTKYMCMAYRCHSLQMEDSSARFVTMVMDRLQAVEEQNMTLQDENKKLSGMVSALSQTLCLKDDLMTFTDGTSLCPAFGEGVAFLWPCENLSYFSDLREMPLDPLHANATAFYGRIALDFGFEEWPELLVMGKVDERTSVQQYLEGIDAWCKHWKTQQPDTEVTQSMQESFLGWKSARPDYKASLSIYALK